MDIHSAQEFLNLLQEITPASLLDDFWTRDHVYEIDLTQEKLRDLRQQLEFEINQITASFDTRNLHQHIRRQQTLAPYVEVQQLILRLETDLAELAANGFSHRRPHIGDHLILNQSKGMWQIVSSSEIRLSQTQDLQQQLTRSRHMKEALQREIEALQRDIDNRQRLSTRRAIICSGFALLLLFLAPVFAIQQQYTQTVMVIGSSGLGALAAAVQLEFGNWRRDAKLTTPMKELQLRLLSLEQTINQYEDDLKNLQQADLNGDGPTPGLMVEHSNKSSTSSQKRIEPHLRIV